MITELPTTIAQRRILVYGVTGSGKTTTARKLGEATGLPWHSVDDLTWETVWVPVPVDEQRRRITAICSEEEWILDTAYGSWLEVPMQRVELIIGLDYPRLRSLAQLIRRTVVSVIRKTEKCNGNVETFRTMFARDSIIRWHFTSFAMKRQRMRAWAADSDAPATILFASPKDLNRWLGTLKRVGTQG